MNLLTIAVFLSGAVFVITGLLFMHEAIAPNGPLYAYFFKTFVAPTRTFHRTPIRHVIDDPRLWYPVSRRCGALYTAIGFLILAIAIPSLLIAPLRGQWQPIALFLVFMSAVGSNIIAELAHRSTYELMRQLPTNEP